MAERRAGGKRTGAAPEPVARVAALMRGFGRPWAVAGGWAVDAWLGRETREHGDVDISVFYDDLQAVFEHLLGWQLLAHERGWNGSSAELWDGRPLELPAHIHCRPPEEARPLPQDGIARTEEGFWLEVLVDEREDNAWLLRREPRVALPVSDGVRRSPWGVDAVVPEVLLFFKATAYIGIPRLEDRDSDNADFDALGPALSSERRRWLRNAIAAVKPDHRWLARLE
ncbi:MAG TPA: hypothetical protein VNN10_13860 [Dehalococcoidia bacterium]|nr:hypothetical protein [Dehalococcoidia bacterium]